MLKKEDLIITNKKDSSEENGNIREKNLNKEKDLSISVNTNYSLNEVEKTNNEYLGKDWTKKNKKKIKEFYIDINEIKELEEKRIQSLIKEIKIPNLNEYEKRLIVLREDKTTTLYMPASSIYENNLPKIFLFHDKEEESNSKSENGLSSIDSTNESTINIYKDYLNKSSIFCDSFEDQKVKFFNEAKSNFYIKKKLFDIPLNIGKENFTKIISPILYKMHIKSISEENNTNDKFFAFVYPNNLKTYYITESRAAMNKNYIKVNKNSEKKKNDSKNEELYGLYFCGNTYEVQNKKKVCSPNSFLCKDCMQLNKEKYFIQEDYLININGRIAKINKGNYHCFGHFLINDQIQECINKFTCQACKKLALYSTYYTK